MRRKENTNISGEKKAITVRLSPTAAASVEKLAEDLGITVNELFRRAIGTELFLQEAKDRGERILLEKSDQNVRELVLR